MLHRPRKSRTFSRYVMGGVFLVCGLLLATQNLLAGGVFLPLAAVVFYYAPRWDLRIEIRGETVRFSENVLETYELELRLADIAEIRRVEEKEDRKGFLTMYQEYYPFVEFETRAGRTYRMHDIFDEGFDEEILRKGGAAGITVSAFPRHAEELRDEPDGRDEGA
ncbi:MAG: hypothetical protein ABIW76_20890 [Fibrobacteria bacterium]